MRLALGAARFYVPMFIVQFLSWGAMFALWVFALPHIRTALSVDEPEAIMWMGIGLAIVAGLGAVWNIAVLARSYNDFSKAYTHSIFLFCGALGLLCIAEAHSNWSLLFGYFGLSIGWASISNTPYAMVTARVKDGEYERTMARFSFSVVIPQVLVALSLGWIIAQVSPKMALDIGGGAMLIAAFIMLLIGRFHRD